MSIEKVTTNLALVEKLIATQCPQWSHLPISKVASGGTDNDIYKLGDDMCVRLPRFAYAKGQIEQEAKYLPHFKALPLKTPSSLMVGRPAHEYPWQWAVYDWLPGQEATPDKLNDMHQVAKQLAEFLQALHKIKTNNAPSSGQNNSNRGCDLTVCDQPTRNAIKNLNDEYEAETLQQIWHNALKTPKWSKPPIWVHGDIKYDNLLARNGKLSAVIDFGLMGVGDPAVDLMLAWNLLPTSARQTFKTALYINENTWQRGRGWALSVSLVALAYYKNTNQKLSAISRHTINEIIKEHKHDHQ